MRNFEEMMRYVKQADIQPPSLLEVKRVLKEIRLFGETMALRSKRLRLWAAPVKPSTVFALLQAMDRLEEECKNMEVELEFAPRDETDHR